MTGLTVTFNIEDPQLSGAAEALAKIKSMRPHTVDIIVRKDGREIRFEGDFLKHAKIIVSGVRQ